MILSLIFYSLVSSVHAELPALLQQVQKEYKKSAGIEAEFDQLTRIKSTKTEKKSEGKIWIKHPNKLRWETISPDQNILVSDGRVFWFFTPPFEKGDRGQVIIRKSAQVQTRFLNALLSGSFDFENAKTRIESKGNSTFILEPEKNTAGDVKTAEITIDEKSKKIERVVLLHSSGNETRINLKQIKMVPQFPESLFVFVPDRNTDQIRE